MSESVKCSVCCQMVPYVEDDICKECQNAFKENCGGIEPWDIVDVIECGIVAIIGITVIVLRFYAAGR